jgi:trehalose 6-phosphate synthase
VARLSPRFLCGKVVSVGSAPVSFASGQGAPSRPHSADLVIASRDLPVQTGEQTETLFHRGSIPGNRIAAISSVMARNSAIWVGACDASEGPGLPFTQGRFTFEPVPVTEPERLASQEQFCNETLWPLYHDIVAHPEFRRSTWEAYRDVNERIADRIATTASHGAAVWVLDHSLQLLPGMLRTRRPDCRIGFFLDIPFPPMELLSHLPWHREILTGLLGADLVGFQLPRHLQNFTESVQAAFGHPVHPAGLHVDGRHLRTGTYPMAVDTRALARFAASPEASEQARSIRTLLGNPGLLLLAFDQLDCTAGIVERLSAFEQLVKAKDIDPRETVLFQIAITSPDQDEYKSKMRDDIDRLVGRINGDAARFGHPPIIYVHSPGPDINLAGLYRAADVLLSTPLRDGMSLSAKEYVACRSSDEGAVVLSALSGATAEMSSAYQVNPYDLEASMECIREALRETAEDRANRMRVLREHVGYNDLARWAQQFLRDLGAPTQDVPCPNEVPTPGATEKALIAGWLKSYPATLRRGASHLGGSAASRS